MAYSARSYLSEKLEGVIRLQNSEPFETAEWSVQTFDPEVPTGELLYATVRSGTGILSNGGKTLDIVLPICPLDDFILIVGSFRKTFNITEGKLSVGSQVVAANGVNWSMLWGGQYIGYSAGTTGPALVYFDSTKAPSGIGGNQTAKLFQGDKLKGLAFGTTFSNVGGTTDQNGKRWPYSGILFYKFGWLGTPPETVQDYTMVLSYGPRGSGKSESIFEVTLSATEAVGPISETFDVLPGQTFTLSDGYLR
jgi:hypothetical protein